MCKSNKIVNVFLNSNNALSGSVNNDATYNIDFSAILKPNKPYRLHWSYVGMPNTFTTTTKLAQIQIDFQMNQYLNSSSTYGAPTTYTIGVLRSFYLNGTTNYLFADDNNNPPIYLQTRPYANIFRVRVLTSDATPVLWTDNAVAVNNNYVLTLSFQELDNEED
jgi:hypothetical protein